MPSPKATDIATQSEITPLYKTPDGQIVPSPTGSVGGKPVKNEPWGFEYYQTQYDGTTYQLRREYGAPSDGSADETISTSRDQGVVDSWNRAHSNTNNNTSTGAEKVDREGKPTTETRWVTRDSDGNVISSDELTPQQSQGRREEEERTKNAATPAKDGTQIAETDAERATRNKKYDDDNKPKPPSVVNTSATEKFIVRQMPDGTLSYEVNKNYVGEDKFSKIEKDPKTGAWSGLNNKTGQWEEIKGGPGALTGPKDLSQSHDAALQQMRLGTVAKASQSYMTELLRRRALPPTDPQYMTDEQASAAMTSFIAEGDQFLREQQGLLGEQGRIQTNQLTQRNQDLSEVQSRRTFEQNNMQQAVQHDQDVNRYLSPGDAHLAGPGFLGQLMMTNQLAQQAGGFNPVAPIQQTPLQQGLMQTPAWVPGSMNVAPPAVPGQVVAPPQQVPAMIGGPVSTGPLPNPPVRDAYYEPQWTAGGGS